MSKERNRRTEIICPGEEGRLPLCAKWPHPRTPRTTRRPECAGRSNRRGRGWSRRANHGKPGGGPFGRAATAGREALEPARGRVYARQRRTSGTAGVLDRRGSRHAQCGQRRVGCVTKCRDDRSARCVVFERRCNAGRDGQRASWQCGGMWSNAVAEVEKTRQRRG